MPALNIESMSGQYHEIVKLVRSVGVKVAPRGLPTCELTDVTITLHDPYDSLPVGTGRGLNLGIGAVEALQLIGAVSLPELVVAVSPNFEQFREPNGSFYGAYGVRVGNQIGHVARKLREDPDTRQAVVTLWQPELDNDPGHKDFPCTISLMFRIRNGKLEMTTIMRSNDIMLGTPYDIFQFTQLQLSLCNYLCLLPGKYTHFTASLHLYERDFERADELHAGTRGPLHIIGVGDINEMYSSWEDLERRAAYILEEVLLDDFTPSEVWYLKQIEKARDRVTD